MPAGKALQLSNLPEDPPCLESLTLQTVKEGDFRKGLRPGVDYTVLTKAAIAKSAVIGLYRAKTLTKNEEKSIKKKSPPTFKGSRMQWRQVLDAYAADIVQPAPGTKAYKSCKDIYLDVLQVLTCIFCVAFVHISLVLTCYPQLRHVQQLNSTHCQHLACDPAEMSAACPAHAVSAKCRC